MAEKVVLAYSGGLDPSVAVRWLEEKYELKVITLTVDIGNVPDLEAIRRKALKVGAIKALVIDARETFTRSYVFPALKADAVYEGQYPLSTVLRRPHRPTPGGSSQEGKGESDRSRLHRQGQRPG